MAKYKMGNFVKGDKVGVLKGWNCSLHQPYEKSHGVVLGKKYENLDFYYVELYSGEVIVELGSNLAGEEPIEE